MKILLVSVLITLSGLAAEPQQPFRELSTQAVPFPRSPIPFLRHRCLITFPPGAAPGDHPDISTVMYGFSVYAPDGSFVFNKNIEVPDGSHPVVRDVDVDTDGSVVVAVTALGGPSRFVLGILRLDRTGRQTDFINTRRYYPASIAIAPDHSLWTLGWQMTVDNPPYADRQDYMIVRHFSADGKEVKACLPRSSFPAGLEPGAAGPGNIAVTSDRVGVVAYSGDTGSHGEWIELDLNGHPIDRLRIDNIAKGNVALGAFSADDHVYLQGPRGETYTIDAASHSWRSVATQRGLLLGADGINLVYRKDGSRPVQLQWFNQP
jgi:hypothetical protein